MMNVTKANGTKQRFERKKIIRTCLRMKASEDVAGEITDKIEKRIYEGIPTKQILKMILNYLSQYKPEIKHQITLRDAVCLLRPKPDFEQFVSLILKAEGYDVKTNKIVWGRCIDHEIDAIATKGSEKLFVEVKHHYQPHSYTGLGVFLEAQATFEDLISGKNKFTKAMVVSNTKISEHGKRYAKCIGIHGVGWKYPEERGLEVMVEENNLHPVTLIKGLDADTMEKLGDSGIVLLEQLVDQNLGNLMRSTNIKKHRLNEIINKANLILGK